MRPVVRPAVAGGRPDIEELAAGRQSWCRIAEEGYAACPGPLAEPWAVRHCAAPRVSQRPTHPRHHSRRQVRVRLSKPCEIVSGVDESRAVLVYT